MLLVPFLGILFFSAHLPIWAATILQLTQEV